MSSSGSKPKKKKPGTDQKSRMEEKKCMTKARQLAHMAMGDEDYLAMEAWGKETQFSERARLFTAGMENLNDPRILPLLQKKRKDKMISESDYDVKTEEPASLVLQSVLPQLDNAAPNQDRENEMHKSHLDSNQLNRNGVSIKEMEAKALQMAKDTQSMEEDLNQMSGILEQKVQGMKDAKFHAITCRILQSVMNSCTEMLQNAILNNPDGVQGYHGVGSLPIEIQNEQLTINFPPAPVLNQEMTISEEKQSKKLTLTIGFEAGGVTQLKLAKSQMLDDLPIDETCVVFTSPVEHLLDDVDSCTIQNYKVSKCNAGVLTEIFKDHPNIAENFGTTVPGLQRYLMNSLAEVYPKIKSEQEKMEQNVSKIEEIGLNDLQSIIGEEELNVWQLKIKDMEHNGLQVSWLKEMLTEVRCAKGWLEKHIAIRDNQRKVQREAEEHEEQRPKFFKKQRT